MTGAGCTAHVAPAAAPAPAGPAQPPATEAVVITEAPPPEIPPEVEQAAPDAGADEVPPLELPPPPDASQLGSGPKRLDFHNGDPRVPVRLMEGATEVVFTPKSRARMRTAGALPRLVDVPAGSTWRVRVAKGTPAELQARVQLAEFPFADKVGIAEAEQAWRGKGLPVRVHVLGSVYGIAGKVVDNRRSLLLVDPPLSPAAAAERQAELLKTHGVRTLLFEEVQRPSSAVLELLDASGAVLVLSEDRLFVEPADEAAGVEVKRVEFGVGYDFHNFEDRNYRGQLNLVVDRHGKLAVVNLVGLEDLLRGLVPSEIFARAHPEALKAQAVTARGEVLAKVGQKHLADPYLLCSEQHCAVYKGKSGEAASTNAAVSATRGEALFNGEGKLVDSVYSAVCGGHTEHNDVVWGGPPNASLRGRPDLLDTRGPPPAGLSPAELDAWLAAELPAACRLSTFANLSRYRWEKRFTVEDVDRLTAHLGIGRVRALSVTDRGVSGRARMLTLSGERGATQVRGELNIRRLFNNLYSAAFTLREEHDAKGRLQAWVFRGAGWGHGVGMCQTGAIGRAEAGQDYRAILRHYFNGAEVSSLYGDGQAPGRAALP
ncbi:MAG: hypothetical protein RL653_3366 [Pseudomonadota bacterium]